MHAIGSEPSESSRSNICLVLEGTYPYVAGGVSSWTHDLVRSLRELRFALVHIGPQPGAYGPPRYEVPANVTGLHECFCYDVRSAERRPGSRRLLPGLRRRSRPAPRMLRALRRLHLEDAVDDELIDDLAAGDLSVSELLYGDAAFEVITEIAHTLAADAPFLELFWHFRSMYVPLVRLLTAQVPPAGVYHSVSTGYAGVVAAVASRRTGRPMLLTEHGIYARERDIELSRATWISETDADPRIPMRSSSALRRLWSRFFVRLSHIAYYQAARIVTLSTVNQQKQLADGAARERMLIVPNGVDVGNLAETSGLPAPRTENAPMRVGFVGRIVPVKDVLTFIRACDIALREVPLEIEIIGPTDEDPVYVERCRALVASLGRERDIRFVGPRRPEAIYSSIDVCVLTSFTEGQPLVLLEAGAAGVPVIATDVGACRELIEGADELDDFTLGPGGIVTRVAAPDETAAAIVHLARNPALRRQLGEAGRARAERSYTKARMVEAYRDLYRTLEGES